MSEQQSPGSIEVVVGGFIRRADQRILLVRDRTLQGKWAVPSGHVEPGESIIEALRRECEEETGLTLKTVTVFFWGETIQPSEYHRPTHLVYFDGLLEVIGSDTVKLDEVELMDWQWCTPDEALQLDLAQNYDKGIRAYQRYLRDQTQGEV